MKKVSGCFTVFNYDLQDLQLLFKSFLLAIFLGIDFRVHKSGYHYKNETLTGLALLKKV